MKPLAVVSFLFFRPIVAPLDAFLILSARNAIGLYGAMDTSSGAHVNFNGINDAWTQKFKLICRVPHSEFTCATNRNFQHCPCPHDVCTLKIFSWSDGLSTLHCAQYNRFSKLSNRFRSLTCSHCFCNCRGQIRTNRLKPSRCSAIGMFTNALHTKWHTRNASSSIHWLESAFWLTIENPDRCVFFFSTTFRWFPNCRDRVSYPHFTRAFFSLLVNIRCSCGQHSCHSEPHARSHVNFNGMNDAWIREFKLIYRVPFSIFGFRMQRLWIFKLIIHANVRIACPSHAISLGTWCGECSLPSKIQLSTFFQYFAFPLQAIYTTIRRALRAIDTAGKDWLSFDDNWANYRRLNWASLKMHLIT